MRPDQTTMENVLEHADVLCMLLQQSRISRV